MNKQTKSLSLMVAKIVSAIVIIYGIGFIISGECGKMIAEHYGERYNDKIINIIGTINQIAGNCAKEGEDAGGLSPEFKSCCRGLKLMIPFEYINSECVKFIMIGNGGGVCSNCGNGICDRKNNENECSCPEDCKEDRCTLIPNTGYCRILLVKYYFDQEEKKCKKFNWGGCEGMVLFKTIEDCKKDCEKVNTSDWQTYRNEEFGFEVKYPEEWEQCEGKNICFRKDISFNHPRRFTEINIDISKNSKNSSFEEIIFDFENSGRIYEQKEYITINNKKVFQAEISNWGMVSGRQFLIIDDNYWYDIIISGTNIEDIEINQILSSFKFID